MSITIIIVGLTVVISYLAINDSDLKYKLTFSPYSVKHHNRWWLVFTHGVVHADYTHLAMNMFTLYFLGEAVEGMMRFHFGAKGPLFFILLYLGGLVFATIPAFRKHADNPGYLALGASGAVSSVVFAFIMFRPLDMLLIYGVIPIPGILLGVGYLIYESYANKQQRTNVAHDAHIAGAIFGVLFLSAVDFQIAVNFLNQIMSVFQ
jgi:membrane associated rhomboid family serine protease